MKVFQIALVDRVPDGTASYFNYAAKNIITYTLWEHLVALAKAVPGSFIPGPSWSLRAAQLMPHDVVVYFVLDPSQSVARKLGVAVPEGPNAAGLTVTTARGVVSEVYVEGSMPARRIANIAFHEIMHIKLDVGGVWHGDLHKSGGLAMKPTAEWTKLTDGNVRLMAPHLFRNVRQYMGAMTL
jgi:hypothetical protein